MQHSEIAEIYVCLFKLIFLIKFRQKKMALLQNLREEISKAYLKLIVKISSTDRETILIALEFY